MDISPIPISDFFKYCKKGALRNGYYWIVCIVARENDSEHLYQQIKDHWQSLDSVTGKRLLLLFAGNEVPNHYDQAASGIYDSHIHYVCRYSPFITIVGDRIHLATDLSSERYHLLKAFIPHVEETQTDAVSSLKTVFNLHEDQIPCIVYVPLKPEVGTHNIIVPIPDTYVDIYKYFKLIAEQVLPLVDSLDFRCSKLYHRLSDLYYKLMELAENSPQKDQILEHIKDLEYYKCEAPIRSLLNRYIDLCRNYHNITGESFNPVSQNRFSKEIETLLNQIRIPQKASGGYYMGTHSIQNITNYNGPVENINGPVFNGEIKESQVIIGNNNTVSFTDQYKSEILEKIWKSVECDSLSAKEKEDIRELINEANENIKAKKKPCIINSTLNGLRKLLVDVGASVAAEMIKDCLL